MARTVAEWIGKTPDTQIPDRVKLRVWDRFGGGSKHGATCQICYMPIIAGPEYDHRVALVNGGENRESNIVPLHARCHKAKTAKDVAIKSATRRTRIHHLGIKKPRRPMPGSRASGLKKKMNGEVVRR